MFLRRWSMADSFVCSLCRQVIYNLLFNALKFTSKGRITVTVSSSDFAQVERHPNPVVKISVADTGPLFPSSSLNFSSSCFCVIGKGIPADVLPLLFDPYFQGKLSIVREYG